MSALASDESLVFRAPRTFDRPDEVKKLLLHADEARASDIFISSDDHVRVMLHDDMRQLTDRVVTKREVEVFLTVLAGRENAVTDISSGRSVNASYSFPQAFSEQIERHGRIVTRRWNVQHNYRVNAVPIYPNGCEITLRSIDQTPAEHHRIDLPEALVRQLISKQGIVFVAGVTGSGKTTTFSAIIRYILEQDTPIKGHILTHEEPIEYRYDKIRSAHSKLVQLEIPTHLPSFHDANREAMRRRPALVLVGEMRDYETISSGMELAQTGHPVFTTVHATDVASIPQRLITRYPLEKQHTGLADIISNVHAMLAQELLKGVDGRLVATREYLIMTPRLREHLLSIRNQGEGHVTQELRNMVAEHGVTFERDAWRLLQEGRIDRPVYEDLARRRSDVLAERSAGEPASASGTAAREAAGAASASPAEQPARPTRRSRKHPASRHKQPNA